MRRDRAQYVYLSSWEDSRRIWPAEAIAHGLDAHPEGMTIEHIRSEVNRITKREMNGIYISHLLNYTEGSIYNPDTELWRRELSTEEDIDEDETEEETSASD